MICLNCKKQIPDDSPSCPYCGNHVIAEVQVGEEIKFRRYQRWFFYILIALIFVGMLGVIIKIYNTNTKYLTDNAKIKVLMVAKEDEAKKAKEELNKQNNVLKEMKTSLETKSKETEEMSAELKKIKDDLTLRTDDYKKVLEEKVNIAGEKEALENNLNASDANIYNLMIKLGKGVSNSDLMKIPLADSNLSGEDADSDGLSNEVETAFGTDKDKADTDGDGYNDKDEVLRGFNPTGLGRINYDYKFANANKGRILLQVEDKNNVAAWYVSPSDGKRYFMGLPANAFRVMRDLNYWTKDWKREPKQPIEQPGEDKVVISEPQENPIQNLATGTMEGITE